MQLVNSDYQVFNDDQLNQSAARLKECYSMEIVHMFLKHFNYPSLIQKVFLVSDILFRLAILLSSIQDLSNKVNLGLFIIVAIHTALSFLINLYFFKSYNSNSFMGQNIFSKLILNIFSSALQIDTLFFQKECNSCIKNTIDISTYDFSALQWFYIKRLSLVSQVHLVVYFSFSSSVSVNPFAYVVLAHSLLQVIYYNNVYSNIFFPSKQLSLFEKIANNTEMSLQFLQSVLFAIFFSATNLAWVFLYLPATTVLFSLLSFIDSRFRFEPFTIGIIEYLFMGSKTCFLIPLLKNNHSMVHINLGGVLKIFYLVLFVILQAVIWGLIISSHQDELPEYVIEIQITLIGINSSLMIVKFFKVNIHIFQSLTIQTSEMSENIFERIKNTTQKIVINYQSKAKLNSKDIDVLEQLMKKQIREHYINFNDTISIQSYNGNVELIVNSMKSQEDLYLIYSSLLKNSKSLNLQITFNCQKYHKALHQFFIFILKQMVEPANTNILFNKQQLVQFLIDNKKTKNIENVEQIFNFSKKTTLEYIIFEKNFKNLLINNPYQVYYDLFDDLSDQ